MRTITSVATSLSTFIGRANRGPVNRAAAIVLAGPILLSGAVVALVAGNLTTYTMKHALVDHWANLTVMIALMG